MGLTIFYSHAVPYIRRQLCYAAERGEDTRGLLRDRHAARSQADGLAIALRILAAADDGKRLMVPGIGDEENLPAGAVDAARRLLGRDADALLGLENMEEA